MKKIDIIFLSETYLDCSIQYDDKKLDLDGYKLARADNLNNDKRVGVGIYFKELLATRQAKLNFLNETIIFEVFIQNKIGYMFSSCTLPSKTHNEFEDLLHNFEHVLCGITATNSLFVFLTGNFSSSAVKWWRNNMTTIEDTKVDELTKSYDLSQTYDLHPSLLPKCHG